MHILTVTEQCCREPGGEPVQNSDRKRHSRPILDPQVDPGWLLGVGRTSLFYIIDLRKKILLDPSGEDGNDLGT